MCIRDRNRAERKKAQKEAFEKRMNKEDEDTSSVKKSDKTDSTDKTGKSEDCLLYTSNTKRKLTYQRKMKKGYSERRCV